MPRTLPYASLPVLRGLIEQRRQEMDVVQKKRGMVVTHVFHRDGEPIHYFRRRRTGRTRTTGFAEAATLEKKDDGAVASELYGKTVGWTQDDLGCAIVCPRALKRRTARRAYFNASRTNLRSAERR